MEGLMQLVAYGAQDVYFFKFYIHYKKTIINDVIVGFNKYKVEFTKFTNFIKPLGLEHIKYNYFF